MRITAHNSRFRLFPHFFNFKKEGGFSLIEILVVMIVITALIAISWAGFYGLRRSMILHQTAESFRSDVIYAQRSSMLLDRSYGENWIRGIGVNLNNLSDSEPIYSLFKWCTISSQYTDFNPGTQSVPEDYDPNCRTDAKHFVAGKQEVPLAGGRKVEVCVEMENSTVDVGYIVFESVTGLVHFFDDTGTYLGATTTSVKVHFL